MYMGRVRLYMGHTNHLAQKGFLKRISIYSDANSSPENQRETTTHAAALTAEST